MKRHPVFLLQLCESEEHSPTARSSWTLLQTDATMTWIATLVQKKQRFVHEILSSWKTCDTITLLRKTCEKRGDGRIHIGTTTLHSWRRCGVKFDLTRLGIASLPACPSIQGTLQRPAFIQVQTFCLFSSPFLCTRLTHNGHFSGWRRYRHLQRASASLFRKGPASPY
jgi:hypothetical protein